MAQVDDSRARLNWRTNSKVEIYSNSRNRWFTGSVVRVFTDDEGEWLEIRYDNTMSKQVQRYSSDIRPVQKEEDEDSTTPTDNARKANPPTPATPNNLPFSGEEMKTRQDWTQDDPVEIYSNTNKEWYGGKIVDIVRDDEGEWLNVIWERGDGEAMSKQVQRFSTDIRPVPQKAQPKTTTKPKAKGNQRANNGQRRAPRFSRSIPSSTHTYPATSQYRRIQKLSAIVEEDRTSASTTLMQGWDANDVADWLSSLGRSYARYNDRFGGWDGKKLSRTTEDQLAAMKIPKLHRCKILLEISRYCNPDHSRLLEQSQAVDVLGWDSDEVGQWVQEQASPLSDYANIFKDNGVDGILLFEIDAEDLNDMGVKRGDRTRILDLIREHAQTIFPDDEDEDGIFEENGDSATSPNGGLSNGIELADSEGPRGHGHRRRGSVQMLPTSARSDDAVVELLCGVTAVLSNIATFGSELRTSVDELQRKANQLAAEKHDDPKKADLAIETVKVLSSVCKAFNVATEVEALERLAFTLRQSPNDIIASNSLERLAGDDQRTNHKRRASVPLLSGMPMINEGDDDEDEDDSDDLSDID